PSRARSPNGFPPRAFLGRGVVLIFARMSHDPEDHAALSLDESERSDYLEVVASLVLADGLVDPGETRTLSTLCRSLEVSPETEQAVIAASREANRPAIDAKLEWIRKD